MLEQKIGFDRIRSLIAARCSTEYAVRKVEDETVSCDRNRIQERLILTDEMRLICMFEDGFPSGGYLDTKPFLIPLQAGNTSISLQNLRNLRTSQDTLRRVLLFFR